MQLSELNLDNLHSEQLFIRSVIVVTQITAGPGCLAKPLCCSLYPELNPGTFGIVNS